MSLIQAKTHYGVVEGVPSQELANTAFLGIPFAAPPIGSLRFAPPQPPRPWQGIRKTQQFAPSPIQLSAPGFSHRRQLITSEDCLYLNIWTPANSAGEKLPVMFWIYGGGFIGGSANYPVYQGDALNRQGVILVTFNYRLSVLGFLGLPELLQRDGCTGNSGLLDQIAALKWVHENIEAFGGDPDNITIFGFSAGAMSCRILISSPLSKHLVKKAIIQSGGGINDSDNYRSIKQKQEICQRAMARLKWTLDDILARPAQEVTDRLQKASLQDIDWWEKSAFQPSIDSYVLTETPGLTIWRGESADIPVISGSVAGDYGWIRIIESEIQSPDWREAFIFSRGVAWAQRQVDIGHRPIYTYHFSRTQPEVRWQGKKKTPHGSEQPYVFGTLSAFPGFDEYDEKLSSLLIRYWTNFAKTGNPNAPDLPEWQPYTAEHPLSLQITDEDYKMIELADTPEKRRAIKYTIAHPGLIQNLDGI